MEKNEIGQLLTLEETARRTSLSVWTWRKWVAEKRVSYVKFGRRIGIPVAEIERIMRQGLREKK